MRIIMLLSLFSFVPMMGMFRSSKDYMFRSSKDYLLPIILGQAKQIYPKHQKQLPLPSQKTKIKSQAEQNKVTAQNSKTKELRQQKENKDI